MNVPVYSTQERQLAACRDDRQRRVLLKNLLAARQAEEQTVLDLRDGVYHACGLAGAVPSVEED